MYFFQCLKFCIPFFDSQSAYDFITEKNIQNLPLLLSFWFWKDSDYIRYSWCNLLFIHSLQKLTLSNFFSSPKKVLTLLSMLQTCNKSICTTSFIGFIAARMIVVLSRYRNDSLKVVFVSIQVCFFKSFKPYLYCREVELCINHFESWRLFYCICNSIFHITFVESSWQFISSIIFQGRFTTALHISICDL